LLDIKKWLESLSKSDHLLLVQSYEAYWVTTLVATLSYGLTKARFWNAGHFVNGVFVVQRDIPLVSVTVESFLVRTVGQWVQYLARHELTVFNIWEFLAEDVVNCATLDTTVHPKYDVLLAALIQLVNYCSDAYRSDLNIEFMLQRQVFLPNLAQLNLTTVDANILLSSYFPAQYDVDDLESTAGLFVLQRAQSFVLASPTPLQWSSECNERWLHLLACMFLPMDIVVTSLTNDEKGHALVPTFPPSFTNTQLRQTYPSLLQKPGYILKEFLDNNDKAQPIYG
jgi:hypothetical protein